MKKPDRVETTTHIYYEIPTVDNYSPFLREWQQGLVDVTNHLIETYNLGVNKANKYSKNLLKTIEGNKALSGDSSIKAILTAMESRDKMYDIIDSEGGLKKGGKKNLDTQNESEMDKIFEDYKHAVRAINRVHDQTGKEQLRIRYLGGTSSNKYITNIHLRESNINVVNVGLVGNDEDGKLVRQEFDRNDIKMQDFGVTLDQTKKSYIILDDRKGKELGNRDVRKVRSNAVEKLKMLVGKAVQIQEKAQTISLEGGTISDAKFGKEFFKAVLNNVINTGKLLNYAPPTNLNSLKGDREVIQLLEKAESYRKMDYPLFMNESEVVNNYCTLSVPEKHKIESTKDKFFQKLLI